MPNKMKEKSKDVAEPLNRRRSARLAELDKEKPKEQPKIARKSSEKKPLKPVTKTPKGDVEVEVPVENNHTEDKIITETPKDTDIAEEHKEMEVDKSAVIEKKDEEDYVVVKKDDVPPPESDEVKEAAPSAEEKNETVVNGENGASEEKVENNSETNQSVEPEKVMKPLVETETKLAEEKPTEEVNTQSA